MNLPYKKLTLKIISILVLSDILETFTHFCFKKSVLQEVTLKISSLGSALEFLRSAFYSPYIWLAFILVFLTFIIWSTILSKIDLSVAVPLASFSYILVPIVSVVFLHEKISLARWLGIILILIGVTLVSVTNTEKKPKIQ